MTSMVILRAVLRAIARRHPVILARRNFSSALRFLLVAFLHSKITDFSFLSLDFE